MSVSHNRRQTLRSPFRTRVAVKTEKAIYFMESWNISSGGAYIESEIQIPEGTKCSLVPFVDECANIFEAQGIIVRTESRGKHRKGHYGMGIRFDNLTESDLQILDGIVRDWQASLPAVNLHDMA